MRASEEELRERIESLEREIAALRREVTGVDRDRALPATGELALLRCRIGEERGALPLDAIQEVVAVPLLSSLPDAEPWVAGLLNLRGRTIPVIDVKARVERSARRPLVTDLVVVCRVAERSVGFVVQDVFDVEAADVEQIGSPGQIAHAPYLLGVFETSAGPVLLFSPERLAGHSDRAEVAE